VPLEAGGAITAIVYPAGRRSDGAPPPADRRSALILGHGAGAGQQSAFMVGFARGLASLGIDTITFNFLYTEQKRRLPDRGPALEACYRSVISAVQRQVESAKSSVFIGGKSMGGRIATQVAAADATLPLAGLVLLGYPLHPPGRPAERRDRHLPDVRRPMLFVQGSRDTFGTPEELRPILQTLNPEAALDVVEGGDHSLKVSGLAAAQAAVYESVQKTIADWILTRAGV
jgi:predicted alpha/beta-hydrolase family hydrolase